MFEAFKMRSKKLMYNFIKMSNIFNKFNIFYATTYSKHGVFKSTVQKLYVFFLIIVIYFCDTLNEVENGKFYNVLFTTVSIILIFKIRVSLFDKKMLIICR